MKHKSILSLLIFLLGFGATTTSCEDMLTPDMDRYAENFSGTDTVYFYLGIVRNLQDMVEQNELLGDMRSDLVATTEYSSDSVANIINYKHDADGENKLLNRAAYYKVINQCNFYLAKVDTNAVKNNIYYMRKEYAQVVAIRAWTYLQLVQTYGRVPFITRPVDNANTGWETNPEAWATADNLVDLLKDDLEKAKTFQHIYGSPNYGNYETGNVSVPSSFVCFQTDLVLGDLYLLRGKDKSDYVEAAKNYYYTLKEVMGRDKRAFVKTNTGAAYFNKYTFGDKDSYSANIRHFVSNGLSATSVTNTENITVIPSAANSSFGRTLTRVQQIYGFDPHSTTSTNTEDTSDGQQTTQSGQISLELNYRSRQIAPSEAYLNLCGSQIYSQTEVQSNEFKKIDYYDGVGDARMHATCPLFQTKDNGKARFITKYATVSSVQMSGETYNIPQFRYFHSIYRLKQVYLRYAEALNRAGYPRHAFMILRDGINIDKMPTLNDSVRYDDAQGTKQLVYYLDSAKYYNAADYVGVDELRRAQAEPEYAQFMDFSSNMWANDGIHEQGCGITSKYDTLYCYDVTVAQRIEDEARRAGALTPEVAAKVRSLRAAVRADEAGEEGGEGEGEVPDEPNRDEYIELDPVEPLEADPLEINAVETLIADECALETAFEGGRMFDLIRFARHKDYDTSGKFNTNYGTEWLAWKIARRAQKLAPYENPAQYDGGLYSTLLNADNWYIANPVY